MKCHTYEYIKRLDEELAFLNLGILQETTTSIKTSPRPARCAEGHPHRQKNSLRRGNGLDGQRSCDTPVAELDSSRPVPAQPASFPATVLTLHGQQGTAISAAVQTQRAACEDPHRQVEGASALSDSLLRPFFEERA